MKRLMNTSTSCPMPCGCSPANYGDWGLAADGTGQMQRCSRQCPEAHYQVIGRDSSLDNASLSVVLLCMTCYIHGQHPRSAHMTRSVGPKRHQSTPALQVAAAALQAARLYNVLPALCRQHTMAHLCVKTSHFSF